MPANNTLILPDRIAKYIFLVRGQKVMLSPHLAELYGVEPRALVQAVKRNRGRFPDDFMFQLTRAEFSNLKSNFVISSWGGMRRATPYAFTEQGVAMLSGVLRSKRAISVNIEIMRTFVQLRVILTGNPDLLRRLDELEAKYDSQFKMVFAAIRALMQSPESSHREIGFRAKERRARYAVHHRRSG
ncbi:MAG: ORF6N domain-containing protein [Chloroflexi bacterium]|nr:ORF6N domain-containing protein [Chloroflexota bacterium]